MTDLRQLDDAREELWRAFGAVELVPVAHPRQRHITFEVRGEGIRALAKRYQGVTVDRVREICGAERRARKAGVPVPEELYRSRAMPLVVHEFVEGEHRADLPSALVSASAASFVGVVAALGAFAPGWRSGRPAGLPRHAQCALATTADAAVSAMITSCWDRLVGLDRSAQYRSCHGDWRADNLLFREHRVAAVLDWEAVVQMPVCEAAGYAAANLTQSWRPGLYHPLTVEPITTFLAAAEQAWQALGGAWCPEQARLASLFAACVRLVQDRQQTRDAVTLEQLRRALGA